MAPFGFLAIGQIASGLMQGLGAIKGAHLQNRMAQGNASMLELQAQDVGRIGEEQVGRHMGQVDQLIGQQRAGQAASGLDLSVGTTAMVREQSRAMGELDAQTMRVNYKKQQMGIRNQASNMRMQGELGVQGAESQLFPTMLGSAANVFGQGMQLKAANAFEGQNTWFG